MKYAIVLTTLAAFAAAQSIIDLPSCSLSCVVSGVSSIGCSATDFKCSCSKADQLTPTVSFVLFPICCDRHTLTV